MIIYDKSENKREFSRKHALGLKAAMLGEDIELGNEVKFEFDFANKVLKLVKEVDAEENTDPELLCVVKEIGLYGMSSNLVTQAEIIFCDDYMFFNVLEGSIIISMEGTNMRIARGIADDSLPICHEDEIKWVSVDDLMQYCQFQLERTGCGRFIQDFLFVAELSGRGGSASSISYKPVGSPLDISGGAVKAKLEAMELHSQAMEAKRMMREVMSATHTQDADEDEYANFDDDEYSDEYDDYEGEDEYE